MFSSLFAWIIFWDNWTGLCTEFWIFGFGIVYDWFGRGKFLFFWLVSVFKYDEFGNVAESYFESKSGIKTNVESIDNI